MIALTLEHLLLLLNFIRLTKSGDIPAYFLAIIWSVIGSGFNEFFSHRVVSISLDTPIIQMFLYICGKAWAKTIPCWTITIRGRKYGINIR
ncbi:ANL_collapsed_G0058580.mRNA.1.CDS.1 [Saccharomyces cerevisiae]|nr:ANL_collapsed_G0058580.mRNA.1.CDS.1 [Saccharomyces cerevisiae]